MIRTQLTSASFCIEGVSSGNDTDVMQKYLAVNLTRMKKG